MTKTDIATRVYNHTWKLDPIIRSLIDTDFYKLLMLQMIWKLYPHVRATFSLINRTKSVRLADEIDEGELREQLDHARTLRLSKKEMIWLAGNSFYGRAQIFEPEFLSWLSTFQLPEYELAKSDGQYILTFHGNWVETTMWEIPALAIINELRSRAAMRALGFFTLDVLYARAKAKMWSKVERLRLLPGLRISDFGTRRRHSFLWQRWCVEALKEGIGARFTGTSNVLLAMDSDLEAVGTNAHELPMVAAALATNDEELAAAPYKVLRDWNKLYGGNLLIVLPDAFGTAAFLRDAPEWVADWTGFRPDSAPPIEGGEKIIAWWEKMGRDPKKKLLIFSDGLDVDGIVDTYRHFEDRVRMSFGWGTNLTNDFAGCAPKAIDGLKPISIVCKVTDANGRPAVKLSDNPQKATGDPREVERYLKLFGQEDRVDQKVFCLKAAAADKPAIVVDKRFGKRAQAVRLCRCPTPFHKVNAYADQKGKYGLKALNHLAQLGSGDSALSSEIAAQNNIPKKFLDTILLELRNAGILRSKKGPGGGYALSKPASEIRIGHAVRVLDGPLAPIRCASRSAYEICEDCADQESCQVRRSMTTVRDAIAEILDGMTLEAFASRPAVSDDDIPSEKAVF